MEVIKEGKQRIYVKPSNNIILLWKCFMQRFRIERASEFMIKVQHLSLQELKFSLRKKTTTKKS